MEKRGMEATSTSALSSEAPKLSSMNVKPILPAKHRGSAGHKGFVLLLRVHRHRQCTVQDDNAGQKMQTRSHFEGFCAVLTTIWNREP